MINFIIVTCKFWQKIGLGHEMSMAETETELLTIFIKKRPRRDTDTSRDCLETETTTLCDQLRTCLRRGQRNGSWLWPAANWSATRFELSQHVEIAQTWSQRGSKPLLPKVPCVRWGTHPPRGNGQFWGGKEHPIVKYTDTLWSSVQKQLNRLRCHLGCGLGLANGQCIRWNSRSPHGNGQFWGRGGPF